MKIEELEKKLLEKLYSTSPQVSFTGLEVEKKIDNWVFDLVGVIKLPEGIEKKVAFEIISSPQIALLRQKAQDIKDKASLINAYPVIGGVFLGERARKVCKEIGVGFADLAGNLFFSVDKTYYEKEVDKNPFSKTPPLKTLFSPIASRIIRVVLVEPKHSWRVRDLAEEADVSVGHTQKIIQRLIDEEFGKRDETMQFFLTKPGELLDEWSKDYQKDKNERLVLYSYEQSYDNLLEQISKVSKDNNLTYALGYFSGALKVAPFIHGFNKAQFFINSYEEIERYSKLLNLSPVENGGNIEIFIPYDKGVFYKMQDVEGFRIVNNIQLYLDLVNNPGRGREQAQHLREVKLKF